MNRKQKRTLYRIIASLLLFILGFFLGSWPRIVCYVAAWLLTGYDTLRKAVVNIGHGQVLDEHFLMTVATIGAFGLGDWSEGAAVMIFFQIGELFESCAVDRSRRSISALMDLRPDYAYIWREDAVEECDPEEVQIGDLLRVLPGERIPVDGVIVEGEASIDTAAITGESVPQEAQPGTQVLSGCVNLTGVLKIRAESVYNQSTVARILELVESSSEKKADYERLITKFARYYTPIVVMTAVLLAALPPLIAGQEFSVWFKRALMFLVMSCPCALVISVPLSFFGGMGAASKAGMIIKGGAVLEKLEKLETVVLDKTGTITTGHFKVVQTHTQGVTEEELLYLAATCEQYSAHPIGRAILTASGRAPGNVSDLEDLPGYGVRGTVDGRQVLIGNEKLMEKHGIAMLPAEVSGTACYIARDAQCIGWIVLADELKPSVPELIRNLPADVVMLTGDQADAAAQVAHQAGIKNWFAKLLPQDKVEKAETILAQKTPGKYVAFVGDGVNDAPVLTMVDIGVAMGGVGSDAAVEAADLVILNDDPCKLLEILRISRKTCSIARQNIVFAIGIKVLVMLLGAVGLASMWMAIFADVGVAVLAILNAMRTMR